MTLFMTFLNKTFYYYSIHSIHDILIIDGYCVTTGYRGMINNSRNHYTYSLGREYNERARKIIENRYDFTEEGCKKYNEQLAALQKEFIAKVFKE